MRYETKNVEKGKDHVNWKYHVAPAVKISGKEELYILDLSISAYPMRKSKYHAIFKKKLTGYVTCDSETYDAEDDCFAPTRASLLADEILIYRDRLLNL